MALAGEGWGGGRGKMRSKVKRTTEVKKVKGGQPHFFGHLFWLLSPPQVTWWPLPPDLKWLRIAPQLGITCSSTVFLHIQMFYFCLSTHHFFCLFLAFLHIFGRFVDSKMAGQTWVPPLDALCDEGETRTVANTIERPLGLLCAFLYLCVRMCAWMCDYVCLDVRVCQVAHKYTVQYSFRYLPPWRINAWTEPWQGANISETITLYSVDNC